MELNTSKITQDQIDEIERDCNERIREKLPVIVHYLTKEEAMDLEEVGGWGRNRNFVCREICDILPFPSQHEVYYHV